MTIAQMPVHSAQQIEFNAAVRANDDRDCGTIDAVSVYSDVRDVEDQWRSLETRAFGTVFQTYDWLSSWVETVGTQQAIQPVIAVGRDRDGKAMFILPFQISRIGTTDVLCWLGGRHSNYQTGLFAKEWLAEMAQDRFTETWNRVLTALPPIDAVHFVNQPIYWEGMQNPLSYLPTCPSANTSFLLALKPDFDSLYKEKRSGSTRRGARNRERRLADAGPLEFREVRDEAELENVLTVMLEQKIPHMQRIGVGDIFGPKFKSFLHRLGAPNTNPGTPLICHYLKCGSQTVATVIGAVFRDRYYGLVLSMTEGPSRRYSPGELALRNTIEACCAKGLKEFDLSQGNADYKNAWTDEVIQQFDTIMGYTVAGRIYAVRERLTQSMKRTIKNSPKLWSMAQTARRHLHGGAH